ncbi:MAG: FAA hydrolase family protein [Betaproteobacteria bacterium]|nr:MAG: FAA hydrolase family protein [Betaproteobacteria bacterium]
MKICQYNANQAGIVEGDQVYPLGDALWKAAILRERYTMVEVIEALIDDPKAMQIARDTRGIGSPVPLASVKLLVPIINPPSIWAAAMNYRAHQTEMVERVGARERAELAKDDLMAEFFLKPSSSLIGPGGTVILPKIAKHVDHECELCAVIGRPARRVSEAQALDHVFGYTTLWDFSIRDPWARQQNTRNIRKGCDTFTGLGPWIVTRDEIADPQDLHIAVYQNGTRVMTAHTADMICSLREHIRFLSDKLTLRTGDLISTGTPAGVSRLSDGDHLRGGIGGIGEMEFTVRAER